MASGAAASNAMTNILLAGQFSDEHYSLDKSLTLAEIFQLAAGALPKKGSR